MFKRRDDFVAKLNQKIASLQVSEKKLIAENNILREKIENYEDLIKNAEAAKGKYLAEIESCKKLAQEYRAVIAKAKEQQRTYNKQMQQEIAAFRKDSKKVLKISK